MHVISCITQNFNCWDFTSLDPWQDTRARYFIYHNVKHNFSKWFSVNNIFYSEHGVKKKNSFNAHLRDLGLFPFLNIYYVFMEYSNQFEYAYRIEIFMKTGIQNNLNLKVDTPKKQDRIVFNTD